jgi:hypothetical protein
MNQFQEKVLFHSRDVQPPHAPLESENETVTPPKMKINQAKLKLNETKSNLENIP